MNNNKILKIISYVLFGIAAAFMVIAISLCVRHIILNSTGNKVTARYINGHLSYLAENTYEYVEFPAKYHRYIEEDNLVSIIYKTKDPSNFYCVKSISNVFIFAGVGFAFLIGTFVLVFLQFKKPVEKAPEENNDSIESQLADDNQEEVVVRRVIKTEEKEESDE